MQLLLPNIEKIEVIAHVLPCKNDLHKVFFFFFFFPPHKSEGQSDFFCECDNDKSEFNRVCILASEFSKKYCMSNCASNVFGASSKATRKQKNWFRSPRAKKFFLFFSKNESQNILVGPK